MPTAIAKIPTPQGIVFASDGQANKKIGQNRAIVGDSEQKIFPIGRKAAYAFCGSVKIQPRGESDSGFDFVDEFMRVTDNTDIGAYGDASRYMEALSGKVYDQFVEVDKRQSLGPFESTENLFTVISGGYFNGTLFGFRIKFSIENHTLVRPIPQDHTGTDQCGSGFVSALLRAKDPRFAWLWEDFMAREPETYSLDEAVRFAEAYILACKSPEGQSVDSKECREIGGRVQIATITPDNGFQWLLGHKPFRAKDSL